MEHAKQHLYRLQQELFAKAQAAEAKEQERAANAAAEEAVQRGLRRDFAAGQRLLQQRARRVRLADWNHKSNFLLGSVKSVKIHLKLNNRVQGGQQRLVWGLLVLRHACRGIKGLMEVSTRAEAVLCIVQVADVEGTVRQAHIELQQYSRMLGVTDLVPEQASAAVSNADMHEAHRACLSAQKDAGDTGDDNPFCSAILEQF